MNDTIREMQYDHQVTGNLFSECCSAPPLGTVQDGEGVCSDCKEHTAFYDEDDEE